MRAIRNRLNLLLIVIGVFALGAVTGASLDGVYRMQANEPHSRTEKEKLFDNLKRELKLDGAQAEHMQQIIDETRAEYRSLRQEVRPRYDSVRQNGRSRIRALLTPEQQKIFDLKVAEKDAARDDRIQH